MKKTTELRGRYAAADRRAKELAQELRDLPARIERVAREEAMSRARTAREGGDMATAVAPRGRRPRRRCGMPRLPTAPRRTPA